MLAEAFLTFTALVRLPSCVDSLIPNKIRTSVKAFPTFVMIFRSFFQFWGWLVVRRENSESTFFHRGEESRPSSWSKVSGDLSSLEMGFSPHSSLENVCVAFSTLSPSQPVFGSECQNTSPRDFLHIPMFMSTSEPSHFGLSFLIPFLISKPVSIMVGIPEVMWSHQRK